MVVRVVESFSAKALSNRLRMQGCEPHNQAIRDEDDLQFGDRVLAGDRRAFEALVLDLRTLPGAATPKAESRKQDFARPVRLESGLGLEKEPVEAETQTAEEQQRRQIMDDRGLNGDRNLKGLGVPRGKVINHACQQHVE